MKHSRALVLAEEVFERVGDLRSVDQRLDEIGDEALLNLVRDDGVGVRRMAKDFAVAWGIPVSGSQVHRWFHATPERSQAYARAREASAESHDEQALEALALAKDPFELAKAREIAAHLRWRSRVINPKKYGDQPDDPGDEANVAKVIAAARKRALPNG